MADAAFPGRAGAAHAFGDRAALAGLLGVGAFGGAAAVAALAGASPDVLRWLLLGGAATMALFAAAFAVVPRLLARPLRPGAAAWAALAFHAAGVGLVCFVPSARAAGAFLSLAASMLLVERVGEQLYAWAAPRGSAVPALGSWLAISVFFPLGFLFVALGDAALAEGFLAAGTVASAAGIAALARQAPRMRAATAAPTSDVFALPPRS